MIAFTHIKVVIYLLKLIIGNFVEITAVKAKNSAETHKQLSNP
jgi:hypothetical protein